jgi:hypothetical protein
MSYYIKMIYKEMKLFIRNTINQIIMYFFQVKKIDIRCI